MSDSPVTVRPEEMGPHFTKYHLDGLPVAAVIHRFTEPDHGDPHDHPFPFQSFILSGGYVEERFALDGTSRLIERRPGESFRVEAGDIHRVVSLPEGECHTVILPGPHERTSGFYRWEGGQTLHRPWDRPDFQPLAPADDDGR